MAIVLSLLLLLVCLSELSWRFLSENDRPGPGQGSMDTPPAATYERERLCRSRVVQHDLSVLAPKVC